MKPSVRASYGPAAPLLKPRRGTPAGAGVDCGAEGLLADPGGAGQNEPREDFPPARVRGAGRADPLGREQRASGLLSGLCPAAGERTAGAFYIDQFSNAANPLAHRTTTAPELFEQLDGQIDAIVVGVGSGGTLGGLQAWFAEHSPQTEFVLADPAGSVLADQVETGRYHDAGSWLVEGIGEDFIPPLAHIEGLTARRITDREAFTTARDLLKRKGSRQAPPPARCWRQR